MRRRSAAVAPSTLGRALLILAAALVGLVAGPPAVAGAQSPARVYEAEERSLAAPGSRVIAARSARGGRARLLSRRTTVTRTVGIGRSSQLVVRARGASCDGAPRLRVEVDGATVLSSAVRGDRWRRLRARPTFAPGAHSLSLSFRNPHRTRTCRRQLTIDSISFSPVPEDAPKNAPTGTSSSPSLPRSPGGARPPATDARGAEDVTLGGASAGGTLFASSFADGISEYRYRTHPERIQVVDDPVLGSARKVLRFRVHNDDTGPTENPRAQIETPYDFEEGDDRYFGFSLYFPADFPTQLPSQGWVTLGEQAYGPPYNGAGGTSLRVQNAPGGGPAEIRWQRNDSYDWDIPWRGPKISAVHGRWVDFVQRIKLHRDARIGFVELWMNTGDGWVQQKLAGVNRLYMRTMDAANDGGANNSRLSLYYRKDIPGPLTLFHGPHRIASASGGGFAAVAPDSHSR